MFLTHRYIQSRNFALNPKEGLKIQAFKNAYSEEAMADRELEKLGKYLLHISNVDFRTLSHRASTTLLQHSHI
jgi:ubiquitin-like domain-containing CTD phosphatase 1